MVSRAGELSHADRYQEFCDGLLRYEPGLAELCAKSQRIEVEWGHPLPGLGPSDHADRRLSDAEEYLGDLIDYDAVRADPGPGNLVMGGLGRDWAMPQWALFRGVIERLRQEILLYGVGDVVYYCGAEGEAAVRRVVYQQVLGQLPLDDDQVHLHLIGHSLGVAIGHDFLYGLFAPDHAPDFIGEQQGDDETQRLYGEWRQRAQDGRLRVGSLSSFASQLPLFTMRKQTLIDRFAGVTAPRRLDPADIGIQAGGGVRWQLFYDLDDLLAFPTRPIYAPNDALKEIQVDCGDHPAEVHSNYWTNTTVRRETARLLAARSRP